jgi:autotransporter-like protein
VRADGWIARVGLLVLAFVAMCPQALAHNIPGSGNLILTPTTRLAANTSIDFIKKCAFWDRGQVDKASGRSFTVDGSHLSLRSDQGTLGYNYDLTAANACVTGLADTDLFGRLLVGVTVGFEHGRADTLFNRGSVTGEGIGGSLFVSSSPFRSTQLFVAMGVTALNYDFTRNDGQVTAESVASRTFLAGGTYSRFDFDRYFATLTSDLRYVNLHNRSYQEFGFGLGTAAPGFVPSASINMLLLTAEARFGVNLDRIGPYALVGISHDFLGGYSLVLPTGGTVSLASSVRTLVTFGGGVTVSDVGPGKLSFEARYGLDNQSSSLWWLGGRLAFGF